MDGEDSMNIDRQLIRIDMLRIPSIAIAPASPRAALLVVHGYGGCKEEQLGLAWRIAEIGFATYAIDLRGHGENELPLDGNVLEDVQTAVRHFRPFGDVVVIGHSLGARLGLLSDADYKIGISPALGREFSAQTQRLITEMRSHRVREVSPGINFDALNHLPVWKPVETSNALLLYGSRDVPEIITSCEGAKRDGVDVVRIDHALHSDIFLNGETIGRITTQLKHWFKMD